MRPHGCAGTSRRERRLLKQTQVIQEAGELNARALRGIKLLLGRQLALQLVTSVAGVVLARLLAPADFGVFIIATFVVQLFALIGDCGLAPALIQRRQDPSDLDLRVAFTVQQALTTVVVAALLLAAPFVTRVYPRSPEGMLWLVRVLAFSLYLTSWRSMGTLQMERNLRYAPLAWIEVVEAVSYQLVAVGLVVAGFGIWALVWATLLRGLLGTALAYSVAPWPLRPALDRERVRLILGSGLRFQAQTILNQCAGWVTPVLAGGVAGPHAVGLLAWAASNGRKPLLLVDNVMRVVFPHISRLQDDTREVERTLLRYLTYLLLAAGLWLAAVVVAAGPVVRIVYTEKWEPGVPALALYSLALVPDVFSWTLSMALNGLGRIGHVTTVTGARNLLFILATFPLLLRFGYNGVAGAYLLAGLASVPFYVAGYGSGAARRLLLPLAWLLAPVGLGVAAGLATRLTPLQGAEQGGAALLAMLAAFAAATWAACPPGLLPIVRTRRRSGKAAASLSPARS
jgi:O-antigen/teichoic acid export membrane protein